MTIILHSSLCIICTTNQVVPSDEQTCAMGDKPSTSLHTFVLDSLNLARREPWGSLHRPSRGLYLCGSKNNPTTMESLRARRSPQATVRYPRSTLSVTAHVYWGRCRSPTHRYPIGEDVLHDPFGELTALVALDLPKFERSRLSTAAPRQCKPYKNINKYIIYENPFLTMQPFKNKQIRVIIGNSSRYQKPSENFL